MKKTLFLSFLLSLGCAADDVFVPQSIITVQDGDTACLDTTLTAENYSSCTTGQSSTIADVLGQAQQFTKNYSKRSAIVKDGQGVLLVDRDVDMKAPLLVREGTMVFRNATVTNTPKSDGNNLSVSGVNAELVLDHASYSQPQPPAVSYSSSVSIGAIDGDGTLTLKNGSSFSTVQTIFTGGSSNLPMRDAEDPAWNANPHGGGSYAYVDTDPASADTIGQGNTYYRDATGAAGFRNPTTTPAGSRLSTATVNVLSGSELNSGTGFYVYNTTLNIDGAGSAVNTGTRNNSDNVWIGGSYGTKAVVNITNGAAMNILNNQYLMVSHYDGQDSEINISGKGSRLVADSTSYAFIGAGKEGGARTTVNVDDQASMYIRYALLGRGGSEANLNISGGSVYQGIYLLMGDNSTVSVDAESALSVYHTEIYDGATLINRGTLYYYVDQSGAYASKAYLYGGSRLQTGEVLVSGCEGLVAEGHDAHAVYATGMKNGMSLAFGADSGAEADASDAGTVTLGALLTGDKEMQYLSSADLQLINNEVLSGLGLAKTDGEGNYLRDADGNYLAGNENGSYTLAFKHEIGKNITLNYTTDDLNKHNGTEKIAVSGGNILVEKGRDDSHADTKVGTIGSYVGSPDETEASIAVSETSGGSSVKWEGSALETVAGEDSTLAKGTYVRVGTEAETGTLNVKAGSSLTNNGTIQADAVVEQGATLKGSGTLGATDVHGILVVGNSPGAPTFGGTLTLESDSRTLFSVAGLDTPATAGLNGWDSGTYSQITLSSGTLDLQKGAVFVVEFGGALLEEVGGYSTFTYDLVLVTAQEGAITLAEDMLANLIDHTEFRIAPEALANGAGWSLSLDRSQQFYTVENNGSTLHLKGTATLIPEPATGTLSLLALAALAARRRRR